MFRMEAQQSTHYTQFMLNEYGVNPAAAGALNSGINFLIGRRSQWIGFDYAPETNFASCFFTLGKKRGIRYYWHSVGAYIENDKYGVFNNQLISASYAFHFKVMRGYHLSLGLAAGAKNLALSNLVFNANDPALGMRSPSVWIPAVIPGVYLSSKKFTIGLSVKDLYQNKLKQGNKSIGLDNSLPPTVYITASRKYRSLEYDYVYIPAIQIQEPLSGGIPLVDLNFIALYRGRVGMGVSYRVMDAASLVLQVKVFSNIVIGLSYDYALSRFRRANPHSLEGMLGFSPITSSDDEFNPTKVSKCPTFDF